MVRSVNAGAQAPRQDVVRLRPGPLSRLRAQRARSVLVPVAVEPRGRRTADTPVLDDAVADALAALRAGGVGAVAVLEHAGPAASWWSEERAVGPSDVPDAKSGRRPLALDDEGWRRVEERFGAAAALCALRGVPCALAIADDGLLQATLSPRTAPQLDDAARVERVLAVHRACGAVDVLLTVEELAPGGLDATDGVAVARALVAQGARRIFVTAGSSVLSVLRRRGGGARHLLASAGWLAGRVDAAVVALVPPEAAANESDVDGVDDVDDVGAPQ